MAKFLKHVGKHGDRKVAIVFRQVPGEEHMCLLVYTELLNQNIHDPIMKCIESDVGQTSENLGEALDRSYTQDGRQILQVLHREGMLKRVQTSSIVMTPMPNQHIRLNELNDMLNEMTKGAEAVKKMAEMDASRGLQDPKDVAKRKRGESTVNMPTAAAPGALATNDLASNLRAQAAKMAAEAKGLLAESDRLSNEASIMEGAFTKSKAKPKKPKQAVVVPEPIVEAVVTKAKKPRKTTVAG
jgi:hypothetical protein